MSKALNSMKSRSVARFLLGILVAAPVPLRTASADPSDLIRLQQQAVRAAVEHVGPSVVQIETIGGTEKVGQLLIGTAPTTGLIVSAEGDIISSAFNFVQQPASILVTLPDGQRRPARIVARDRSRMLVLLKVDSEMPLAVPTAAPRESMEVGETAIAVGRTFSPSQLNLSVGILSAKNRIWGKAVQTDANVSPANYGGPLVDLQGRVLGVLVPLSPQDETEIAGNEMYDSGIGFAVPLLDIQGQLARLQQGEDLFRGKLGIELKNPEGLDPDSVIGVVKLKSPAAEAGLQSGDRILAVNGTPTPRYSQLRHALLPLYAGDTITLEVQRGEQQLEFSANLVAEIPPYEHAFLGILPTRRDSVQGVGVRFVYPDSPAERAGLRAGDRWLKLSDATLESADQARLALAGYEPGASVPLTWLRAGETITADAVLARLPSEIPAELPVVDPADGAPGELETGRQAITIPEEPNSCTAYVPESINRQHQAGLLVILGPPGGPSAEATIARWQPVCDRHDLVLLVPQPADDERWQRTEVDFVRKTIDQAITRFDVGPQRVAVLGQQAGGAMAYLVGLRNRDRVRAIAIQDATLPARLTELENEPLQRLALMLLVAEQAESRNAMRADAQRLREWKFPVTEVPREVDAVELSESECFQIGRWIDSLDRL